jgi:pimeloyl-ACP methyl ester carboxylesterase
MIKKILVITGSVLVLAVLAFIFWAETPLQPMSEALTWLTGTAQVHVQDTTNWVEFTPTAQSSQTGIIFYPGGRVDYRAYAPLMQTLAAQGTPVFLVKMPFSLAVFDIERASDVITAHPEITSWVIGGHSLGGAMAAQYASEHKQQLAGVFFLAAYATEGSDLSQSGLPVASIVGDQDGLATSAKLQAASQYLPASTTWVTIPGGNHAQMGWYGLQPGDGAATISRAEQQQQVATAILDLLSRIER